MHSYLPVDDRILLLGEVSRNKLLGRLCHNVQLSLLQPFLEQKKYIYIGMVEQIVYSISISFGLKAARSADITNTCGVLHSAPAHYVWKLPLDVSRCRSTRSPSGPHLKLGRDLKAEH